VKLPGRGSNSITGLSVSSQCATGLLLSSPGSLLYSPFRVSTGGLVRQPAEQETPEMWDGKGDLPAFPGVDEPLLQQAVPGGR
jgi:hypothetical protein